MFNKGGEMADKEEKQASRRPGSWDRTYNIEIDAISKRHLSFFISNELSYYNSLVNDVNMRLRAFPDDVMGMRGTYDKLWSAVAFGNVNLRALIKRPISKWHEIYKTAAFMLPTKDGKLVIEDKKLMLFDALTAPGKIHPNMRRSMATELLKTAISQAENLSYIQKSSTGTMRSPVQMLLPAETHEKRHVQLTNDLFEMRYDREKKQSEIRVPYTDRPLVIKDHDVSDEKATVLIIRQPADGIDQNAPWQVSFMNTQHRYLMEVRDQSGFQRRKRVA